MDINSVRCIHRPLFMGSVATFMIVLIMKPMPQIKLCVLYKYGNITYKHDDRNDMYIKWTIIMMDLSNEQL